jgi:hypothetical protein
MIAAKSLARLFPLAAVPLLLTACAVNRILDFADVFTLNVGAGVGLHAEAHFTHFLAAGLGGAYTWNFGLSERPREYGVWQRMQIEGEILPFAWGTTTHEHIWGSLDERHPALYEGSYWNYQSSLDEVYQKQRDYWGIGGSATLGVVSAQLEIHPLQLWDFFASAFPFGTLVFYDVLADEY